MARLLRVTPLDDRFDTQVFTFVLPRTLTHDAYPDVVSREFVYGDQAWSVSFGKSTHHVGAYLLLSNVTAGMTVCVDFTFCMLNPDHFTRNDVYVQRACRFTSDAARHGRQTFIGLSDLLQRGFLHDNGEYVVELELRSASTTFEQIVQLPRIPRDNHHSNDSHAKFETGYFAFGNLDWNLHIYPNGDSADTDGRSLVFLTKQTNFDHSCRAQYRLVISRKDRVITSDVIEQCIDMAGQGRPYEIDQSVHGLIVAKGKLSLKVEMLSVATVSEVELLPLNRERNRAHLYDRENQGWLVECDVSTECLRLRMYYSDVRNVPRRFTRLVTWSAKVVTSRNCSEIKALGCPFSAYYTQTDTAEECYEMDTNIASSEVRSANNTIVDKENRLVVHVEWLSSHLLYNEKYNGMDEVCRKHKHQMLREILALQAENYALEKQMHSIQLTTRNGTIDGGSDVCDSP